MNIFNKKFLARNPELILSSGIILLCIGLSLSFPSAGFFQDISKNILFLIFLPALYLRIVLKKNITEIGFGLGDIKSGLIWGSIMLLLSLLTAYFLINYTTLRNGYQLPTYIIDNFWMFVLYEFVFVNLLVIVETIFFRGFILFTFAPRFFYSSILIQAFLYWSSLFFTHNFNWQMTPYLITALTSGVVAYKSRSIIYPYLMTLIFIILLDAYLIHSIK